MNFTAIRCELQDILKYRQLFLQESNFQIRYNACHERNWSDPWLLFSGDSVVGYGCVKGKDDLKDRDALFEFYVLPEWRRYHRDIFESLLRECRVPYIECQSNDFLLSSMLYEFSTNITSDVLLFDDHGLSALKNPGVVFRLRHESEPVFDHKVEPVGEYVLERAGEVVATGGFMLHYNFPFADLYMEVKSEERKKGYGSYLIQELKKACYTAGRVPAARTSIDNFASRACLLTGGMRICGYMLTGRLRDTPV